MNPIEVITAHIAHLREVQLRTVRTATAARIAGDHRATITADLVLRGIRNEAVSLAAALSLFGDHSAAQSARLGWVAPNPNISARTEDPERGGLWDIRLTGLVEGHRVVGFYREGQRLCLECFEWPTTEDDYAITSALAAEEGPNVIRELGLTCAKCSIPMLTRAELDYQRVRTNFALNIRPTSERKTVKCRYCGIAMTVSADRMSNAFTHGEDVWECRRLVCDPH